MQCLARESRTLFIYTHTFAYICALLRYFVYFDNLYMLIKRARYSAFFEPASIKGNKMAKFTSHKARFTYIFVR